MKSTPPPKQKGRKTGPRRLDGLVMDVAAMAQHIGDTEKGIRAKVARGVLPYRRFGMRVVFVRSEVSEFLRGLPGLSAHEALANQRERT